MKSFSNSPNSWLLLGGALLGAVVCGASIWQAWRESEAFPSASVATSTIMPSAPSTPRPGAPEIERCAECHADVVKAYRRNGMSHSFRSLAELQPDFRERIAASAAPVRDEVTSYRYAVAFDKDELLQVETRPSPSQHRLARNADYAIGSGKHATAFATAHQGYLRQLPLAWFATDDRWGMSPGYELQNHRFARPISAQCVDCHGGDALLHRPPTKNQYHLPLSAGIACSACHGDTAAHEAFWREASPSRDAAEPAPQLILPSELPSDRANDLCFRCHLQGDVTLYAQGARPGSFQPGESLRAQRFDFLLQEEGSASLSVASHGARMLRSACYQGSEGRLTCVLCHDGHHAAEETSVEFYESRCAKCHPSDACNRPTPRGKDRCVACHMPSRTAEEGIHLALTDHAIVRFAPATSTPAVNLAQRDLDRATLVSVWPNDDPAAAVWGAAYMQLHQTLGPHPPSVKKVLALLDSDSSTATIDRAYWFASAELASGKSQAAAARLQSSLEVGEDLQRRYVLALAYEATGDPTRAIGELERVTKHAPNWSEPWERLGRLYLATRQPHRAAQAWRRLIAHEPTAESHARLALAMRLAGEPAADAEAQLQASLALDPLASLTPQIRGAIALIDGDTTTAQAAFQRAIELEPGNEEARQALRRLQETPSVGIDSSD